MKCYPVLSMAPDNRRLFQPTTGSVTRIPDLYLILNSVANPFNSAGLCGETRSLQEWAPIEQGKSDSIHRNLTENGTEINYKKQKKNNLRTFLSYNNLQLINKFFFDRYITQLTKNF